MEMTRPGVRKIGPESMHASIHPPGFPAERFNIEPGKRPTLNVSEANPFVERLGKKIIEHPDGRKETIVFERMHYVPGFGAGTAPSREGAGLRREERIKPGPEGESNKIQFQQEARTLMARALSDWKGYFPHDERQETHMWIAAQSRGWKLKNLWQKALSAVKGTNSPSNLRSNFVTARSLETGKTVGMSTSSRAFGKGNARSALIEYIVLHPEFRKFGLGRDMLDHHYEIARNDGAKFALLETEQYTREAAQTHAELSAKAQQGSLRPEEQKELTQLNDLVGRKQAWTSHGYVQTNLDHNHTLSAGKENPLGVPMDLHVKRLDGKSMERTPQNMLNAIKQAQLALYESSVYGTPELGLKIAQLNRPRRVEVFDPRRGIFENMGNLARTGFERAAAPVLGMLRGGYQRPLQRAA